MGQLVTFVLIKKVGFMPVMYYDAENDVWRFKNDSDAE
jgi:hypothetical protein